MSGDPFPSDVGVRLVEAVIAALGERPELRERLGAALRVSPGCAASPCAQMTVAEYADYARMCERSVRYLLPEMKEGEQYLRVGRKGGRIRIQVVQADAWRASRAAARRQPDDGDDVLNEVVQRRAKAALKKLGIRK